MRRVTLAVNSEVVPGLEPTEVPATQDAPASQLQHRPKDLNNLYFLARVVDFGSYTAAAEALGMRTSKLSRRVGALERELVVRLLNCTALDATNRRVDVVEEGVDVAIRVRVPPRLNTDDL